MQAIFLSNLFRHNHCMRPLNHLNCSHEPLMMIHYNDEAKLEQALEYFKAAYRLAPKRPTPPPLIDSLVGV